jgi:hypothetical protein
VLTDGKPWLAGDRSLGTAWNGDAVVASTENDPSVSDVRRALTEGNVYPLFLVSPTSFPADSVVASYASLVSAASLGIGVVASIDATVSDALNVTLQQLWSNASLAVVQSSLVAGVSVAVTPSLTVRTSPGASVTFSVSITVASTLAAPVAVLLRAHGFGESRVTVASRFASCDPSKVAPLYATTASAVVSWAGFAPDAAALPETFPAAATSTQRVWASAGVCGSYPVTRTTSALAFGHPDAGSCFAARCRRRCLRCITLAHPLSCAVPCL